MRDGRSTIAAQNPELTHALDNARKKIESGSERLRERVADVARTTATRTLDGVEKLLDVIDPIQLSQYVMGIFCRPIVFF